MKDPQTNANVLHLCYRAACAIEAPESARLAQLYLGLATILETQQAPGHLQDLAYSTARSLSDAANSAATLRLRLQQAAEEA